MAGRLEGKVAFVSGLARSMGRSHALLMAQEGADIIGFDICGPIHSNVEVGVDVATDDDLKETVRQIEALDRRVVWAKADARDGDAVQSLLNDGLSQLGRIDIVAANAGILSPNVPLVETKPEIWDETIQVNVTGVWNTIKAAVPAMIEQGNGGSIVITSSVYGLRGLPGFGAYAVSKHAVVGLMRTWALELAPHSIRVNTVHPSVTDTPLIQNKTLYTLFRPDLEAPTKEQAIDGFKTLNLLDVPWIESIDVSNAVVYLASDEARYVTGLELKIDAGACIK